jgi:phosphate/sulfate permease
MKSVLTFASGALTFFLGLAFVSFVVFFSDIIHDPLSEQFLIAAALIGPALVLSAVCAASFWLGVIKFGPLPPSTNHFVIGLLCALVIYVGLLALALSGVQLSPLIHFLAQLLLAFIVCYLAVATIARRRG